MTRKKNFSAFAFLAVLLFLISSCQHRLGGFQASSREVFDYERVKPSGIPKDRLPLPVEAIPELLPEDETQKMEELPVIEIPASTIEDAEYSAKKVTINTFRPAVKKTTEKEKPKKKKNKKKKVRFNDGLKIGTIFLVIAIIMGIFSLTQLTLLFGLVSILFLYFGLKKYYRQRRRRNIFKNK